MIDGYHEIGEEDKYNTYEWEDGVVVQLRACMRSASVWLMCCRIGFGWGDFSSTYSITLN